MTYPEEIALDQAVTEAVKGDQPDAVVIGWAHLRGLPAARRGAPRGHRTRFAPSGQPKYATIGLLMGVADWLRGIGGDEGEA